jgi:hypothetical protein
MHDRVAVRRVLLALIAVIAGALVWSRSSRTDGGDQVVNEVAAVSEDPVAQVDLPAGARDPWMRPFSPTSIWNTPIGSGAEYADAEIPEPPSVRLDAVLLQRLSADDPERPLFEPGSWDNRCSGTVPTGQTVPIPDDLIIEDASDDRTPNNVAALLLPDGRTLVNTNAVARCDEGGPIFGFQTGDPAIDRTDLYGDGRFGSHGASRLSGIGGAIRPGELSGDAPVRHALDLLVWAEHLHWGGDGYRWPAAAADSYASSSYAGSNPEVQMGSLLAIPPWMTASSLGVSTPVGLKLFAAMQDYGGYVTDDSAWATNYISVDQAAIGTFAWGGAEEAEMKRIIDAAHVVVNNGPTSVGGGGTPRQPLLPELAAPGATTASPATAPSLSFVATASRWLIES